MDKLFPDTLEKMEATMRLLERRVPQPQLLPQAAGGLGFRYIEKNIHQAIVQKLARVVSGLYSSWVLLENGFTQEQAAIHRMLDEFQEDITFLAQGAIRGEITPLHNEYLQAFYEEEFDKETALKSTQKRPMVARRKIHAYLSRVEGAALDPSTAQETYRTLNKTFSGFVHGASPQIMDMYGGSPPRFHVSGMLGSPRIDEHRDDLWNYFYRGILSFCFAAKAFGDEPLFQSIRSYSKEFEKTGGKSYSVGL